MDCRQVLEELANFMDEEVGAGLREALEEHLAFCHKCEVIYQSTRRTLQIASCTDTFELPPEVSMRLYEKLQARLKSSSGA